MRTIADLIAASHPDRPPAMSRRRHDSDPNERARHIQVATDRLVRRVSLDECRARYGIGSPTTVRKYISYALDYDDPMSEILRIAVKARRTA